MTARERLFAALDGQPADRTPIWLLFPYHRTGYYADVRTNPCYVPIFRESLRYAVTLNRRNLGVRLFAPDVEDRREQAHEDGWQVTRRIVRYRGRELRAETRQRGDEVRVRRLLSTDEDLQTLLEMPLNTDPAAIAAELDGQLPQYQRERAEFPADAGAMMLDLGEPIGFLYHNADLETYAMWSLGHDTQVRAFLDQAMRHYRAVYDYCLSRELAEVYFLVGSELASPPLVGRPTFQRWIVPYARELIGMVHSRGCRAIQHYHGQIRLVLPDFLTMGADALHTIEAPPTGDCTLAQAFDIVGDRMTLIGNIQYDCFRWMTPGQMRQAVADVLAEARGKRLILSPSAGPYEEFIPPNMVENYLEFLRAGWQLGSTS